MKKKIKNTVLYWIILGLKFLAGLCPHRLALSIGAGLGGLFHDLVPKERQRALKNLKIAFPDMDDRERAALTRRVFVSFGRSALELFSLFSRSTKSIVNLVETVEGREHMEAALARNKGVCCLTAHMDNWEILVIYTNAQGWPSAAVAQALYDERLDVLLNRFRESHGVKVIKRKGITKDIIRTLRSNHLLGMLNDQDTSVDSLWAPFFNRPAKTPVGIFRLARKGDAAVVPIFIVRQPSGRHKIIIEPALRLDAAWTESRYLEEGVKLCNQVVEKYVKLFPDQWVWFHDRWKHQPPKSP